MFPPTQSSGARQARARTGVPPRCPGFTLVELIGVIALLGTLAAMAMPRLAEIGREARVAALQGVAAAAAAELALVKAKCAVSTDTCDVSSPYSPATGAPPTVVLDGVTHRLSYGYYWSDATGQGGGLAARLNLGGFEVTSNNPPGSGTQFRLLAAPDPSNCKLQYQTAWTLGTEYFTALTTTGC